MTDTTERRRPRLAESRADGHAPQNEAAAALEAEERRREARRILAVQASTRPEDGNIGPTGAWARAEHVQVLGRNAHERIGPHGIFRSR